MKRAQGLKEGDSSDGRWAIDSERRKWQRIPMAVPFFLRYTDESGREVVDFTVALNVSMGGTLVASRCALRRAAKVSLEIPASPLWQLSFPSQMLRAFKARVVRTTHHGQHKLYALRFTPPLTKPLTVAGCA